MISARVGAFHAALERLTKSLESYSRLATAHPDSLEYRLGECRAMVELGALHALDYRSVAARHWYEKALARLEAEYARAPDDPELGLELAFCLLRFEGNLSSDTANESREKLVSRAAALFEKVIERKHRGADARDGLCIAKYRLASLKYGGKDWRGFLKSFDEVAALFAVVQQLDPTSPYINNVAVTLHRDRAVAHVNLAELKEAIPESEASVAAAREIVRLSPERAEYGNRLAEALKYLAYNLRRVGKEDDARATFEESIQVIDALVRSHPDWAFHAAQWIDFQTDLAGFFEYGPKAQGEIQARQDLLRALDVAVRRGRELAARFPDHHQLQVNFAYALASRGRYDTGASRNESALPYLLEVVEVYRSRIIPGNEQSTEDDVNTYLSRIQIAANCALALSKGDEVIRLGRLALEVRTRTKKPDALNELGAILSAAANVHRDAGHFSEAIEAYRQAIEVRRPAYEAATWHWDLHNTLGATYLALADTYHRAKDHRNEVLAQREYLRLIVGPWWNTKVDEYLDPARPTDEAEAERIGARSRRQPAMGACRLRSRPNSPESATHGPSISPTSPGRSIPSRTRRDTSRKCVVAPFRSR